MEFILKLNDYQCDECNECVTACLTQSLTSQKEGIVWNKEICSKCECCVDVCPTGALTCEWRRDL